ncbi:MAG: hypothetical protein RIT17_326 [Pseudomonadota bacterium]
MTASLALLTAPLAMVMPLAPLPEADTDAYPAAAAAEPGAEAPPAAEVAASPQAERPRDLTLIINPYLWMPVVDGKVGGTEPGALAFELDTGDLLEAFDFGGLIHGELHHASGWGLSVDYMFADLSTGGSIGPGAIETVVDASILEVTVLRRVPLGKDTLDVYAGIRRWDSEVVVDVELPPLGFDILTGDTWTDPIAGARYRHPLSAKWALLLQGDVGGFGVDSDFTWHAVGGFDFALSRRVSMQLVYKCLSVERQSPRIGGGPPVDLDLTVEGPLLGVAWQF